MEDFLKFKNEGHSLLDWIKLLCFGQGRCCPKDLSPLLPPSHVSKLGRIHRTQIIFYIQKLQTAQALDHLWPHDPPKSVSKRQEWAEGWSGKPRIKRTHGEQGLDTHSYSLLPALTRATLHPYLPRRRERSREQKNLLLCTLPRSASNTSSPP